MAFESVSSVVEVEKLLRERSSLELIEFREFLHEHYNFENLTFWMEVESFRAFTSKEKLSVKALEIYIKYFGRGSDYELNIPDIVKVGDVVHPC